MFKTKFKSLWQLKPILLVLFFLLADKVMLIPWVYNRYTNYVEKPLDITQINGTDALKNSKLPSVWAFGTSRSIPFKEYPEIENLKNEDEAQIYVIGSYGYVIAPYLTQYLVLRDLGYKPDYVFIEVSSFEFNKNNGLVPILNFNGVPAYTMLKQWKQRSLQYQYQYWLQWLIVGIRRQIVLSPDIGIRLSSFANPIWNHKIDLTIKKYEERFLYSSVKEEGIIENPEITKLVTMDLFNRYSIDTVAESELKALINLLKEDNIPYVLWRPVSHSTFYEFENLPSIEGEYRKMMQRILKETDSQFVDFQAMGGVPDCDLWSDPVHVANQCYPIINRILWTSVHNTPNY